MEITKTNIPDIISKIELSKVDLANSVIEQIYPLLDEAFSSRINLVENSEEIIQSKKSKLQINKLEIESLMDKLNRKKKIKKLLGKIKELISSGLVQDGRLRSETVNMMQIVDMLPEDQLDVHLNTIVSNIQKRFN
jgi:uncharacterized protein YlbG (UPF0298 family)